MYAGCDCSKLFANCAWVTAPVMVWQAPSAKCTRNTAHPASALQMPSHCVVCSAALVLMLNSQRWSFRSASLTLIVAFVWHSHVWPAGVGLGAGAGGEGGAGGAGGGDGGDGGGGGKECVACVIAHVSITCAVPLPLPLFHTCSYTRTEEFEAIMRP